MSYIILLKVSPALAGEGLEQNGFRTDNNFGIFRNFAFSSYQPRTQFLYIHRNGKIRSFKNRNENNCSKDKKEIQ